MEKLTKFLIGFLLLFRLIFLNYSTRFEKIYLTKDSDHYLELSSNVLYFYFNDNLYDYWLSTFRLPGYPLILNLFQGFLDKSSLIFLNFIFDAITLWLIYKILQKYFYKNVAYIGCILFLINPNSLISSSQIMTESISTTFFFLSFYFFDEKKYILTGIAIGLLGILKPLAVYVLLFYLIILVFRKNNKIIDYLKISFIPLILIGSIYINNFVQYETSFYSTSSYFHMQWFNEAGRNICENYDFNELEVSEPGYVFENWLLENDLTREHNSKILINELKNDSRKGLFNNIQCKFISLSRSTVWNMFGIRGSNWENVTNNNYINLFIRIFSLVYVVVINFSLLRSILSKNKNQLIVNALFITLGYILVSAILPFGNSRIRVLVEPFLIIIFVDSLKSKNFR